MCPVREFSDFIARMETVPHFGSMLILGMGVSGIAVSAFCLEALAASSSLIDGLTVYAGKGDERNRAAAQPCMDAGVEVLFDTEEITGHFDTCVVSPGISENSPFYRSGAAASDVIMSEPEFAWHLSPDRWIGITGTNGKTTTTSLCAHLLRACGMDAVSVGNIGDPCITAVRDREPGSYLVAELSSYQLASTHELSPEAAVLLNVTPDHLAWHGSHEAYTAAKMKLFDNLAPDALAIVDVHDRGARRCAEVLAQRGTRLLGIDPEMGEAAEGRAAVVDGRLCIWLPGAEPVMLAPVEELAIKGEHNLVNALAAAAVVLQVGVDPVLLTAALPTFQPLEHRIEPCGVIDGVGYFNDSKATNTDAVLKALTAFGTSPLIVLLGGHDKGTDLSDLVEACTRRCRTVVCFGEARERFLAAFDAADVEVLTADHLHDALLLARDHARPGDVVLLSPACSSFDEFDGFEQRGTVFKGYVKELQRV